LQASDSYRLSWSRSFKADDRAATAAAKYSAWISNAPSSRACFPNEDAITRVVGALLSLEHDERGRYVSLETIAALRDDVAVKLPVVAT
jgi:hypothetical protein